MTQQFTYDKDEGNKWFLICLLF